MLLCEFFCNSSNLTSRYKIILVRLVLTLYCIFSCQLSMLQQIAYRHFCKNSTNLLPDCSESPSVPTADLFTVTSEGTKLIFDISDNSMLQNNMSNLKVIGH